MVPQRIMVPQRDVFDSVYFRERSPVMTRKKKAIQHTGIRSYLTALLLLLLYGIDFACKLGNAVYTVGAL